MSELVSMAQQFSGLPMDALIGAPLIAATEANSKMSQSQMEFLLNTCFENQGNDDDPLKPIMIKMVLTRGVVNQKTGNTSSFDTSFTVPLMTFISINTLGVDNVTIHFDMEVKSSFDQTTQKSSKGSFKGSASAKIGFFHFNASVSYDSSKSENTHYQKSNSAKYSVDVHAAQLPIPKGVQTVLEAFTKTIDPLVVNDDETAPKPATQP